MSKSYVTMEQHACLVCGKAFDTGSILMDKRFKERFEASHTVTGWGLCPEHEKLHKDGYVALVGVDKSKSKAGVDGNLRPEDAYRTGEVCHVRRSVWNRLFGSKPPDGLPVVFCDPEVIGKLKEQTE